MLIIAKAEIKFLFDDTHIYIAPSHEYVKVLACEHCQMLLWQLLPMSIHPWPHISCQLFLIIRQHSIKSYSVGDSGSHFCPTDIPCKTSSIHFIISLKV